MAQQTFIIRNQMATHLQEQLGDGEIFRWPIVWAYHAAWLQHLEQYRATSADEGIKLKIRRALAWHRVAPPESSAPTSKHGWGEGYKSSDPSDITLLSPAGGQPSAMIQ